MEKYDVSQAKIGAHFTLKQFAHDEERRHYDFASKSLATLFKNCACFNYVFITTEWHLN